EVALATGRLPCAKIAGAYKPIDDVARSADAIVTMLASIGGSRYLDNLGEKAVQWSTRIDGIGTIAVSAIDRAGNVQARIMLTKRDAKAVALDVSVPPPQPPISAVASARPAPQFGELELELDSDPRPTPVVERARDSMPLRETRPSRENEPSPPTPIVPYDLEASPMGMAIPNTSADGITFDRLVATARALKASDLHIIAERPPLMRIGGELTHQGPVLDARAVERMIGTVVPQRAREELEAHGAADFAFSSDDHGRLRVNATRQRTGYKLSIRLIPKEVPTLASLGLPPEIANATKHHQGLIVVTGPTGHGKTSTLAAIVDILNRETTHHIITVEDPIEYVHPRARAMMSQREVGAHTKSFANALKASLREDPDVVVVGELRDTETVQMALSASETGHLVLGTMNTPSAAKTIDRLIDLFPPADQGQVRMTLAVGLRLIVSQRLVPTVDGKVVVAAELLPGSIALGTLIRDNKTFQIPSLQQRGRALGIIRLEDSLIELVKAGKISIETARAESPEYDKAAKPITAAGTP
ncbi:MAG: PilT/PilU family type 4a pilus ATPase, partial [Polyangiaceae bacterium]